MARDCRINGQRPDDMALGIRAVALAMSARGMVVQSARTHADPGGYAVVFGYVRVTGLPRWMRFLNALQRTEDHCGVVSCELAFDEGCGGGYLFGAEDWLPLLVKFATIDGCPSVDRLEGVARMIQRRDLERWVESE